MPRELKTATITQSSQHKKIQPSSITIARGHVDWTNGNGETIHGMKQSELAEIIGVNTSLVSAWERRYRPVPIKYLSALSEILKVPEGFLLGELDIHGNPIQDLNSDIVSREIILPGDLYYYDKKPIYLIWLDNRFPNSWAIYNASTDTATDTEHSHQNISKIAGLEIHRIESFRECDPLVNEVAPIEMTTLMTCKTVFVRHSSTNPTVDAIYDGWYHHNETKTCLIKDNGIALPYDGLNVSYKAFAPGYKGPGGMAARAILPAEDSSSTSGTKGKSRKKTSK